MCDNSAYNSVCIYLFFCLRIIYLFIILQFETAQYFDIEIFIPYFIIS